MDMFTSKIKVKVKPNSSKTEIVGITNNIYTIAVKAPARDNKANLELIKFISKKSGKKARIISGVNARIKLLSLD